MKCFNILLIPGLALFSIIGSAQNDTVLKLTLIEAQNYAIENFFLSKNAELDIDIAKKKILETTAIGLPQVSANADYQHIPNPPTIEFPAGPNPEDVMSFEIAPENNLKYGATVTQLLFSGEYIVGLQASRVYRLLSEENYEKVKIELRESVSSNYYSILVLENNEEALLKTLEVLRSNLGELRKTSEAGLIDDTEVDQLELTVKRTETDLASLKNQVEYLQKLLKYQLGVSINTEVNLVASLDELIGKNIISDSLYNFVLDEHIDYKILKTNESLQKLSLNRERTTYLPTVSGFYSYSDQTSSTDFSPTINHVLGVSATWKIFQSGMRHAKVSQAKIALEQVQNMKEQESEKLKLNAKQTRFNYQTALNKYYNEKLNFELSEKVLYKTNEKFKQGMVSSLELSLVNTQFLQAQITYTSAIHELLTTKTALDKAYNQL